MKKKLDISKLEFGEPSFGNIAPGKALDLCIDCGGPFEPIGENVAIELRCPPCQARWRINRSQAQIAAEKNNRGLDIRKNPNVPLNEWGKLPGMW